MTCNSVTFSLLVLCLSASRIFRSPREMTDSHPSRISCCVFCSSRKKPSIFFVSKKFSLDKRDSYIKSPLLLSLSVTEILVDAIGCHCSACKSRTLCAPLPFCAIFCLLDFQVQAFHRCHKNHLTAWAVCNRKKSYQTVIHCLISI